MKTIIFTKTCSGQTNTGKTQKRGPFVQARYTTIAARGRRLQRSAKALRLRAVAAPRRRKPRRNRKSGSKYVQLKVEFHSRLSSF